MQIDEKGKAIMEKVTGHLMKWSGTGFRSTFTSYANLSPKSKLDEVNVQGEMDYVILTYQV